MLNGYIIPLDIQDGLPYMPLHVPTNNELDTLLNIILISDMEGDSCVIDNLKSNDPDWISKIKEPPIPAMDSPFNEYGDYHNITVAKYHFTSQELINPCEISVIDDTIDYCVLTTLESQQQVVFAAVLQELESSQIEKDDTVAPDQIMNLFDEL